MSIHFVDEKDTYIYLEDLIPGSFVQYTDCAELIHYGIYVKTTIHKRKFCGVIELDTGEFWNIADVDTVTFMCPMEDLNLNICLKNKYVKGKFITKK